MRILFLSFYFEPDLSAGSFRNTPLVTEITNLLSENDEVVVITTQPNRYKSYSKKVSPFEQKEKVKIHRINVPLHKSGIKDQIKTFRAYYKEALKISKQYEFDLVYSSSSRLFTAYLGRKISRKLNVPFYVDVRDIFVDTIENLLRNRIVRFFAMPILNFIEAYTFKNATHINLISQGFYPYFKAKFPKPNYSFFSNGIDDIFLKADSKELERQAPYKIVYAGNIGEGQGLEKIVPILAKNLGDKYLFEIYGDGGTKSKLVDKLKELDVKNVIIYKPVDRIKLTEIYTQADFLFLHLNDFKAFEKVLPSKLFEYGTYNVPIIAGVKGYAKEFITENLDNTILFEPLDYIQAQNLIENYNYKQVNRKDFINKYRRSSINKGMADSIVKLLLSK